MVYIVLHNVRSVHNVGSIFRTADAAGVSTVYLTGYTPTPIDRFGRSRRDFAKVSLGAERAVPWEYRKNARILLKEMKAQGVYCVAVEQADDAINYRHIRQRKQTAFLLGNEVTGLPEELRTQCDVVAEIPMRGTMVRQAHHPRRTGSGKESLNVTVAAGIVLFGTKRYRYA